MCDRGSLGFVAHCALCVLGIACAADAGSRDDRAPPVVTAVVEAPGSSAPAPADATARAAPNKSPPSLPPAPPGVDPERFAVLASLCAVASFDGPSGTMVGCRSTPPFDGPGEQPDGAVRKAESFSDVCFLSDFYRGSFSGPGKDQVVLGLEACGDDRVNDIAPGNVVLAERGADGWRVVAVEKDTNARGCRLSKRADRTLLVCGDNLGAFGDGSLWWRFTLDFSLPAGGRANVFAKFFQTPGTSCLGATELLIERGITQVSFSNERFADRDGDGDEDLSFTVERSHAPPSPALGKKVEAQCAARRTSGDATVDLKALAGAPRRVTLEFDGEGTTLVPKAGTKKLLEEWGKVAPELWWNLK
jgi:hypothetical protein